MVHTITTLTYNAIILISSALISAAKKSFNYVWLQNIRARYYYTDLIAHPDCLIPTYMYVYLYASPDGLYMCFSTIKCIHIIEWNTFRYSRELCFIVGPINPVFNNRRKLYSLFKRWTSCISFNNPHQRHNDTSWPHRRTFTMTSYMEIMTTL